MEFDQSSDLKLVHVIPPAVYTGDKVGAIVDTLLFESLTYSIHVGVALTGGGFTVLLEEGDASDLTGSNVVAAGDTIGALPVFVATDANLILRVGVVGKKRYQRLTLDEDSTVTAGVIGVSAILGNPRTGPVAEQAT